MAASWTSCSSTSASTSGQPSTSPIVQLWSEQGYWSSKSYSLSRPSTKRLHRPLEFSRAGERYSAVVVCLTLNSRDHRRTHHVAEISPENYRRPDIRALCFAWRACPDAQSLRLAHQPGEREESGPARARRGRQEE